MLNELKLEIELDSFIYQNNFEYSSCSQIQILLIFYIELEKLIMWHLDK